MLPFPFQRVSSISRGVDRRSHGRLLQEGVSCNLGVVLDLSAGGMRVLSTKATEGLKEVRIKSFDAEVIVHADVVWCKRLGFRRHELGLRFKELEKKTQQTLTNIAMTNRLRQAI
jgi:c-di-GMP-binding flagellar brake protein YcgR